MRNEKGFFKRNYRKIKSFLKNPGLYMADSILSYYGREIEKIPYPVLKFLKKHLGGFAGISIHLSISQYRHKVKIKEIEKMLTNFGIPIIVIIGVILLVISDGENFFRGFIENLAADIVLLVLAIYALPKVLNKPKFYDVSIVHRGDYRAMPSNTNKAKVIISIRNTGQEVYKIQEVFWEVFLRSDIAREDIVVLDGRLDENKTDLDLWRISGFNDVPLFLDDKKDIFEMEVNNDLLCGGYGEPYKIYFRFRTINGNIPDLEGVTKEFLGFGIPVEQYPEIADYCFDDWYDPTYFHNKEKDVTQ
ncbi:MAG: hypothetical protein RBT34_12515 [Anaerolineaceae bacterium]|nr:hypothetical protein [Anaerolineaceae bacterium]